MPVTAAVLTAADGDFPDIPGQPYVSPDDLASIGPLWQQAVQQQLVPIVAEVYQTSAGVVHAQMVDATQVPTLPSVGSLAAEQYLAAATNTFAEVGDDLWATARSELLDGFEKGESIDQLAARLRASAGMTAKKATLVARTQVLDASNAGSIATARAAGIDMQKEWMSAEDLRVRPEHVLANGQKVDLNAKFTVGGYECDRPHDPTLPPALRYSCRCTTGYLIPDDSVDDAVDDARPVPPIPGTSGVEPLPDAGDLVSPALPGPDLGVPAVPGAGLTVRPALKAARTTTSVGKVFATEYRRITGRDIDPNSLYFEGSVATAREHAEGVLRGLERFPDIPLERVVAFGTENEYASATSRAIRFNQVWTSPADRKKYLDSLAQDEASRWHVPGSGNPVAVALHEFGHVVDTSSDVFKRDLDALLARTAAARDADLATARAAGEMVDADDFAAGGGVDGLIRRDVSRYATRDRKELAAEAFADVMINGDRASDLSRGIFTLLEAEYRRGGGVIRSGPEVALPSLPGPLSAAQFEARATAALRGKAADKRPRVQAEIDAKNSDSATWKATGFDGLDRPVPGGTTAVTTYLRRPAFANDRLRFPDGQPRQDWEPPVDPAKAAKDAAAADRQIANLDKLMAQSPLDSDTILWRGARPGDIGLPDGDPVGFEWADRGFVSTSGRRSVAEGSFAQSEDAVLLRILAPDGTPALGLQGLGEAEVLLGRGLTFRVVAEHARLTRPAFSGKKRLPGARVLDVEIVPAAPVAAPAPAAVAARSVAQLRALAKERGITIPAGSKKADIVRLLDEGPTPGPAVPAAAPRLVKARAGSTIGDVELGPTQFQIAIGEADLPRRPVGDFTDRPYDGPDGAVVHRGTPLPAGFDSPLVDIRRGEYTVRPGLTDAESQALDRYVLSRVADPLNTALRQGTTPPFGTVKIADQIVDLDDVAVQLDAAIGSSELAADTILYRGALMRPADLRKLQPGAVTREDAFLSTTTESGNVFEIINWRKGRDPAGGKSPVIFEILAPRGTRGAVADVGEREVLLGRGRRFRVVEVRRPTRPGDTRRIVLEILPDTPDVPAVPVAAPVVEVPLAKRTVAVGADALEAAPSSLVTGRGLTTAQKSALRFYQDQGGHDRINNALRAGEDVSKMARVTRIDEALAGSPLTEDVLVYRGAFGDRIFGDRLEGDLIGFEWTDPAYQSTSAQFSSAAGFGGEHKVILELRVPQGTHGVTLSRFEKPGPYPRPDEAELLLDRGLRMRVVGERFVDRGGLKPDRVLTVEVVPGVEGVVVAPPAVAPLASRTVAQLRALAAERNITVPKGARKPDIVRLLETTEPPPIARPVPQLTGDRALTATRVSDSATDSQKAALDRYGGDGGYNINRGLREGNGDVSLLSDRHQATVEGLDAVMEQAPAASDLLVYRTVERSKSQLGNVDEIDDLTGFTWTDQAYVSTSADAKSPNYRAVIMTIRVPRGIGAVSDVRHLDADEILLQRGLRFRVTADHGLTGSYRHIDVEVMPAIDQAAERAAARALARETNALIEQSSATARVLAEVDELLAKKASASTIREALDDALAAPGQLFAGADLEVLSALRAVASDAVKLRAAVTRLGGKAKIKPVSKAGAKVTFDADTMEGVGGIDIPDGTRVTVVRRGSTVTLPDGTVMQLEKARVTPVPAAAVKAVPKGAGRIPAEDAAGRSVADFTGGYGARQAQLRTVHGGEPTVVRLEGGIASDVQLLTYPDGFRLVRKDYQRQGAAPHPVDALKADAEELAAQVLDAFDLPTPAVVRVNPHTVEMEFVDGVQGGQSGVLKAPASVTGSDQGRRLGLADAVMGHRDRNGGGWMRVDGGIVPIDNGGAFGGVGADQAAYGNPFTGFLMTRNGWKRDVPVPMTGDELVEVRARLVALRPEFVRLGYARQHKDMLGRFDEIAQRAVPAAKRTAAAPKKTPAKKAPAAKATPTPAKVADRVLPQPYTYRLPDGVTQSDADALQLALRRRQPIEGMPGADDAALVERLAVQNNTDNFILGQFQARVPEAGKMTASQIKADMAARAKAAFADRPVATNVTDDILEQILTDGRFKTQFEAGRSAGYFNPQERAFRERQWFGIPEDAPDASRPIYGYLVTGDGTGMVDMYGGAQVIFRSDIRRRTTAMVGDSLGSISTGRPAAVDSPDWYAFNLRLDDPDFARLDRDYDGASFNRRAYIEAQIHGGVTVGDVAEVVFSARPSQTLIDLLAERGIPWRVRRR